LGANILFYDRDKDNREDIGEEIAREDSLTIIKPYDSLETIFGQGTSALEAIQQTDVMIDSSIICAGGGGLSAGCSIILKKKYPEIKIYTAEPEDWNDHEISFKHKKILTSANSGSRLCDGILTRQPGKIPFSINLALNLEGLSCEEAYVFKSIKLAKDVFGINLEPSGAIALANLIKHKEHFLDQSVLIFFSGGNIDPQTLNLCLSNAENNNDIIDI
jgi:threonine dehydratase